MQRKSWSFIILVACLFMAAPGAAQDRTIQGRVVSSETGQGIAAAAVTLEGTRIGVLTDTAGIFSISAPTGPVVLVVRSIGFRTREIDVAAGQSTVSVTLEQDVLGLDELVITGTATSLSRRNLANAVSTVNAEALNRTPSQSVEKAIQGKVAGANISANSGAPGGGIQVRLRGVGTINAQSSPLYVIDGVIVSNAAIPSNANAVTAAAGGSNPSLRQDAVVNRIADINPADIQSVEILKGPSAAAIYGSKAANGVVIITTKRGRGEPRVTARQQLGYFDLSNTLGFRRYETLDEAFSVFLVPDESTAADTAFIREQFGDGEALDYEELLANRNDLSYETSVSVRGAAGDTRYFVSGLIKDDAGIIPNTTYEKQSVRMNLDQRIGDRLELSFSSNVLHTLASRGLTNNDNSGTSFYMVFPGTPNFADLRRNEDGTFPDNPFERSNPLQTAALMDNDEDVWRAIGSAELTFEAFTRGAHAVQLIARGGADYFTQENALLFPPELQFEPRDGLPGTSLLSNSNNANFTVSGNGIYTYAPLESSFRATTSAGIQYEDDDLNIARVVSRNLIAGQPNIDAGTQVQVSETRERIKDIGIYLQEEVLMLDERMTLTAGIRADRSSANADEGEFFFYPKAAASYRFSNLGGIVNELKLRAAYGQTGNRPLYGQKFTPLGSNQNIEGLPGLTVAGVTAAPDIHPERQAEFEGGIDAYLLEDRGRLSITAFQRNITDLLLERELAPSSGFDIEVFNGGELRVRGIEAGLEATPFLTDRFTWITNATFAMNRSEVLDLPVPAFRTGGFGTALGAFEIAQGESATQIVANVIEGDSTVVRKVGDANPDFTVGFSNELRLGDFSVYGLLDWQQGGTIVNLTKLLFDFGQNTADFDLHPQFVDSIGPIEVNDTLTAGERRIRGFGLETRPYIEDASFVKLRELSVSYRVPDEYRNLVDIGAEEIRLTLSGRDLLTFTDYSGLDPEVSNFGNQPIARNIDVAPFPPSRSFWVSVDVSF